MACSLPPRKRSGNIFFGEHGIGQNVSAEEIRGAVRVHETVHDPGPERNIVVGPVMQWDKLTDHFCKEQNRKSKGAKHGNKLGHHMRCIEDPEFGRQELANGTPFTLFMRTEDRIRIKPICSADELKWITGDLAKRGIRMRDWPPAFPMDD